MPKPKDMTAKPAPTEPPKPKWTGPNGETWTEPGPNEPAQSHRADPRKALLEMILEMRDRDEVGDLAAEPTLRERIAALETENTRLRAALAALKAGGAGKAVAYDVPEMVERVPAPAAKNVVPLKPSSAPAAPEPPSKPFVNGLSDVPTRVEPASAANVVPLSRPRVAAPAPAAPAAPGYDYDANSDWKSYVNSDGSIRSTPRGGGHD